MAHTLIMQNIGIQKLDKEETSTTNNQERHLNRFIFF